MRSQYTLVAVFCAALFATLSSAGCSTSFSFKSADQSTLGKIRNVQLAKRLDEAYAPIEPSTTFHPDERVCISVQMNGKPSSGKVRCHILENGNELIQGEFDLGEFQYNSTYAFGSNINVGFWYEHPGGFDLEASYEIKIELDGEPIGTYPFAIEERS